MENSEDRMCSFVFEANTYWPHCPDLFQLITNADLARQTASVLIARLQNNHFDFLFLY
jgi:hypothetical protein